MPELSEQPFAYSQSKAGVVMISCAGKTVTTLKCRQASKFLHRIEQLDTRSAQLLMAKLTGQFKFGNERQGKSSA